MPIRDTIQIDEKKCDGCGLCVPSCEEGAIAIIDGKAKVVSDVYCDGLGACLGHCPQGAISIVQRDAEAFDEEAVAQHLAARGVSAAPAATPPGCPGTAAVQLKPSSKVRISDDEPAPSRLANWPVQLHLVPPHAPLLQQADLLLVADCVPFACANFHARFLDGRPVVIGCPKLDDCQSYVAKLAAIIQQSQIRSITVVHMEVPCCTGLLRVAEAAIRQVNGSIPLHSTVVTRRGEIVESKPVPPSSTGDSPHHLPVL